ncbi:serine-threonine protein kinase 19-domain-containing protein [Fennellomyces sp. T-0311]|nr:serine-threonine protein kinase 19-domain-containing protein [Fennellomyces sp. T-0311]
MDRKRKKAREHYAAVVNQVNNVPDVYGIKKRATERKVLTEQHDDEFDHLEWPDISETVITAQYLISNLALTEQARRTDLAQKLPRVCFLHQIYSIITDNTMVDRELQEAIDEGSWRKFHIIGSLEDEFAIMNTNDYVATIDDAKREFVSDQADMSDQNITAGLFDRFKKLALDSNDVAISQKSEGFDFTDKEVSCLIKYGVMLPHVQKTDTYWFAIRRQGLFMSHYIKGRVEILRILKKRPTHDILQKVVRVPSGQQQERLSYRLATGYEETAVCFSSRVHTA